MSHYETLNVAPDAEIENIRREYLRLALKLHPDKQLSNESIAPANAESHRQFQIVARAYEVLSDPVQRADYDAKLREQSRRKAAIHEQVTVEDMTSHGAGDGEANHQGIYSHPCRCGGVYEVYASDVEEGPVEVPCSNCSLHIEAFHASQWSN
ncbi:hypothetical protein SeMB42_g03455 [Synchytrium endobioticum]|uniref:Diphthamide biosynthesis protein 4 n=1 Tax=Synchytrium endobioticum TaxID=286115 RepID=A0A507D6T3_9FUNG|nr:hypothetical protein SeMB42_g03455 [Synchytrium endobioticum]TPX47742.1 hypothetical protein SeLEV6574_g02484 [Synchytrium endobioticum]